MSFKPTGYNSLSPYLIVDEAEKLITLVQHVFEATITRKFMHSNGAIQHAELKIDDSILMLSEATADFPANQFLLHVYVPDVYKTYQRAIDYGCEGLKPPQNEEGDPDIRGMFKDFAGNVWAVGMQQAV